MKNYTVSIVLSVVYHVPVKADTPEEAEEIAKDIDVIGDPQQKIKYYTEFAHIETKLKE